MAVAQTKYCGIFREGDLKTAAATAATTMLCARRREPLETTAAYVDKNSSSERKFSYPAHEWRVRRVHGIFWGALHTLPRMMHLRTTIRFVAVRRVAAVDVFIEQTHL